MKKFMAIATVFFALAVMSLTIPQVFGYHEDPGIDIHYTANPTIGESVTIDCTKDDTNLNMLMTVFRYDDGELLAIVAGSSNVVSFTLIPQDSSMIQVFCEYVDDKGDKVGYAIMRAFTPQA